MQVSVLGKSISDEEKQAYVDYVEGRFPKSKLEKLTITIDGDFADLEYEFEARPFERIRRITGYLVGTIDRWNDSKRAEERDRVKHSL
ncbi:MAG: anaerobic ribonucleoside-triphosphate reductase [Oscillospiraceae bacterium]|nr:anaerobic ribonucleoside-triphosphate reductase [Oscillospiraceae bacterium]